MSTNAAIALLCFSGTAAALGLLVLVLEPYAGGIARWFRDLDPFGVRRLRVERAVRDAMARISQEDKAELYRRRWEALEDQREIEGLRELLARTGRDSDQV